MKTRTRKHRNDQNHGKSGMVGGNERYNRRYPMTARGMGRCGRPRTPSYAGAE